MKRSRTAEVAKLQPGSPADPAIFGSYYLLGRIARGGMAEVYRARPISPPGEPELCAIKVMRPSLAREARFVDMFHSEGQLAMLLDSPSIVRTHELGQAEGRHYIAMEYLSGQDLTQLLRRCQERGQRLPIPHAVYIASRIAEGMDHAHRVTGPEGRPLNIVNRDVSPSNVRITYDGGAKILDFGIARALMKFTSEIGILKGKFSYMSPEQIRGMPLDARSDVFSAGIILHEMLTTERLFRGDTEFALMETVRKAEVPPPSSYNRKVSSRLDEITLRALARNVDERYQSAAEFRDDLGEALVSYGFEPRELTQLLAQLFRRELRREQRDCQIALHSLPGAFEADDAEIDRELVEKVGPPASQREVGSGAGLPRRENADPTAPAPSSPAEATGGGFWSRFRRKRKR